jgi:hypothetical protein
MADFARIPYFTWQVAAVCELRAFEGDPPVELSVVRFVNDAHSASGHLAQNVESPVEDIARVEEPIEDVIRLDGVVRWRPGEQRIHQKTLHPLLAFDVAPNFFEERPICAAGFAQVTLALLARPGKRRLD